jgi:phosphate transport system substrate-binding protein
MRGYEMRSPLLPGLLALLLPMSGAADVTYGGSSTLHDTVLQGGVLQGFQAKTGVKVVIGDISGTGKGLKALAEGKLSIAGAGRTLTLDERKAGLLGTIVAYDGLALFVNRANPVKSLSRDQLKAIYTGKTRSWKEVGGKDLAITPIIEPLSSKRATVQLIQELVLDGAPFLTGIREMEQLHDQVVEVSKSPGAFCVASVGFLSNVPAAVKANVQPIAIDGTQPTDADIRSGAYLLSRPMLLVTKGVPAGDVKKFVDYLLSRDGQAVVEKFFVAVKR